jgi:hypothetical protein
MRRVIVAGVAMVMCACGSTTAAMPSPSPTPSPTPLACTAPGHASSDFPSADKLPATPGIVSANVSGDVLTLTFATGTPAFEVTTQAGTHFIKDPSGMPVDLAGKDGVQITLRGFRGDVVNLPGDPTGSSLGPLLQQVMKIGDFEGVIKIAAGLASPGCANVSASGSTLTIHFVASPA